jgi:hypothetical protein
MNSKLLKLFNRYRNLLKRRVDEANSRYKTTIRAGNRSKNRILDFYLLNGKWPSIRGSTVRERKLARRFENLMSKESASYDYQLRRIALVTGRKTNNKRKHDIAGFKKQIISFIEEHGRAPNKYSNEKIEGEGNLQAKLNYYTAVKGEMTFLGEIYALDNCHRSGIAMKYRPLINKSVDVERPLVRLPNKDLE